MVFNFVGALIAILLACLPGLLVVYLAYRFLLDNLTKRIDEMEERQRKRDNRNQDEIIAELNDRIDRLEEKLLGRNEES